MKKRSARMQELLAEAFSHAEQIDKTEGAEERYSATEPLRRMLYSLMDFGDDLAFQTVLAGLRQMGYGDISQYCWDWALQVACDHHSDDGKEGELIGLPFQRAWDGVISMQDRRALTKLLKAEGVVPPEGKLQWFSTPQPLGVLQAVSPVHWFGLNSPWTKEPDHWRDRHSSAPGVYVLVGRISHSPHGPEPQWPELSRTMLHAQAQALGWLPVTMKACAPLFYVLTAMNTEDDDDDPRGYWINNALGIVDVARAWIGHVTPSGMRSVEIDAGIEGPVRVYLCEPHMEKTLIREYLLLDHEKTSTEAVESIAKTLERFQIPYSIVNASKHTHGILH